MHSNPEAFSRVLIDRALAEARALEEIQARSRRRLDDLFQALLHRAFAGEL